MKKKSITTETDILQWYLFFVDFEKFGSSFFYSAMHYPLFLQCIWINEGDLDVLSVLEKNCYYSEILWYENLQDKLE